MNYSLALPLAALLFTSCRQEKVSEAPSADAEMVAHLEERLGSMEDHISNLNQALEDSVDHLNTIEELRADLALLKEAAEKAEVEKVESETVALEPDAEEEPIDPRMARLQAVGELLGTVHTLDGRTFYDTRITRVTDVGIEVQHRDGTARLHFSGLAPEMRDRFSYIPALAQKALQLEQLANAQRSDMILRHTLAQLDEEKKRREEAEAEARQLAAIAANIDPPQPVHHTTQVIVEEPYYHGNQQVILPTPIVVNPDPYCPPTTIVRPPLVKPPLVRPPVVSTPSHPVSRPTPTRPTTVKPTPVRPTARPTPVSRPAPVIQRPTSVRPSAVRPQAPARPMTPSQRR